MAPQYLADQLTLFQLREGRLSPPITTYWHPQCFSPSGIIECNFISANFVKRQQNKDAIYLLALMIILLLQAAPVHGCYYLSTDCFYVEINIEGASGRIVEAKVHHIDSNHPNQQASTPKNCPEIINCLTKGDFNKFIDHLEGLMSIYDMPNASAQDKTRGWHSLSILEADLIRIDNLSR